VPGCRKLFKPALHGRSDSKGIWKISVLAGGRPCSLPVARIRVHDLKHTYGRRLRSCVSLETRKLLLGHKNGDINNYSAAEIGELVAASDRISAAKANPASHG
jgi:hypothetical protein